MEVNKILPTEPQPDASHEPQKYAGISHTQNLIATQRRFGVSSQIFNWQKTGISFRINAPYVNTLNDPLVLFRVTPLWLPSNFFETYTNKTMYWDTFRPWYLPVSRYFSDFSDTLGLSKGVTIFEEDNPSLLSILAFNSVGWVGGLDYCFKIISNSTSQGKLVFSRLYDVSRPLIFGAIEKTRTPFDIPSFSQSDRMKNGFVMQDLSSRNDITLSLPYSERQSWKSNNALFSNIFSSGASVVRDIFNVSHSYVSLDIAESVQPSAGAASVSVQVWIRARPDFQLIQPGLIDSTILDRDRLALYDVDHGPMRVFGEGGNIRFKDGSSASEWERI